MDFLIWSFWFFIRISALMIWFRCLFGLFGDHILSGVREGRWALLLIFLPWLGAFIHLIARGKGMNERAMSKMAAQQAAQEQYIQQVAAKTAEP